MGNKMLHSRVQNGRSGCRGFSRGFADGRPAKASASSPSLHRKTLFTNTEEGVNHEKIPCCADRHRASRVPV